MATKNSRKGPKPPLADLSVDALGDDGRAEIAAQVLVQIQANAQSVRTRMAAEGFTESDHVPEQPFSEDGEPFTFGMRLAQYRDAEVRVLEANREIIDDVRAFVRVFQVKARAARNALSADPPENGNG
jgi:hypothetical protein